MTQTANYQLNQWESTDRILMEDFNEDNAKIDAALEALAAGGTQFITGSYTGTGTEDTVHFAVGVRPKLVIVGTVTAGSGNYQTGMIATENFQLVLSTSGCYTYSTYLTFADDGFNFRFSSISPVSSGFNRENAIYQYLVIC